MEVNKIYCESNLDTMARMPDNYIDLTVTSPPYDNLRDYKGYSFEFEKVAKELYRVTKEGGVIVWIVGDGISEGSETLTSFNQAIYFKKIGFKIWDTMIYMKKNVATFDPKNFRYKHSFEYMFILSKGKPKSCNLIKDKPTIKSGTKGVTVRNPNGKMRDSKDVLFQDFQVRFNIWEYNVGFMQSSADNLAFEHPAIFPEKLAADHIYSWSNEGDLIYDCFTGSGTTLKMAHLQKRNWIGSEISAEYCELANKRMMPYLLQQRLF